MYSFPNLEPVCCSMSGSNCCFLTCIQISQEAGQVVWYSHLLKNFPQFVVIHIWKAKGCYNLSPRDGIFHQTVSRLPAAKHIFLRSWMVDICQVGHSLRSALQRRHMAHMRCALVAHPGNQVAGTGEVIKMHGPPGQCAHQAPGHLSCSDLGMAQNACPTHRD